MRILHLIDEASVQATDTALLLLAQSLGRLGDADQCVLLFGSGQFRHRAEAVGIQPTIVVSTLMGRAFPGWFAVQRCLKRLGPMDVVHCWTVESFTLACLMFRACPRVLTVTTPPAPSTVRWLRMLVGESPGQLAILPTSSTIHRALVGGGLQPSCVHVLRPGMDLSKVAFGQRGTLHQRWGVNSQTQRVLALLSDPPEASDAVDATLAALLADGSSVLDGTSLRMLVHPRQAHRLRAQRVAWHAGRGDWFIQEPRLSRPWEVLPGCDLALGMGPHAGGLSLLWAMSANVPIVGEATYAISEIVEDRHSALLTSPGQPKSLALKMSQVFTDPHLAWQIRDTARHEAYSFFSRQNHVRALATVYSQLVSGQSVQVPLIPETGGLRFVGTGTR